MEPMTKPVERSTSLHSSDSSDLCNLSRWVDDGQRVPIRLDNEWTQGFSYQAVLLSEPTASHSPRVSPAYEGRSENQTLRK